MSYSDIPKFLRKRWHILGILLLAAVMRLPLLNGSLWLDEAAQALESARPLSQQLHIVDDFQPPLFHVVLHFWMMFGHSEWWMRLGMAYFPGILTVLGVYLLAKRFWGETAGRWAALLLATSAFHIFYSQELRPYAMPAALAVWSWILLLNLSTEKGKTWQKILFGVVNALGLYASYLYPFLMIGQAFYLFFVVKKRKVLAESFSLSGILFAPWLPSLLDQLQAGQALRSTLPGWQDVVGFGLARSVFLLIGKFLWGQVDLELTLSFLLPSAVVGVLTGLAVVNIWRQKSKSQPLWVFLCWAVIPLLTIFIISLKIPILQPKRVLYLLPVWYMLLAGGSLTLTSWLKKIPPYVPHLCLAIILGINCWSVLQYWTQPALQREDWRGLYHYIHTSYPVNTTLVAFAFDKPFAPWEWYDHGQLATITTKQLYTTSQTDLAHFKQVNDFQYVLSFDYLQDLTDPGRFMNQEIKRYGFEQVTVISPRTPIGQVRVFAKPKSALSWRQK